MTRCPTFILALLAALQAGCDSSVQEKPEPRTPMPAGIAGVYAGEFPCSNCSAIKATLWLRPDGRFFFRQRFVDDAKSSEKSASPAATTTYGLGRWDWDEITAELVLRGSGPERRLVVSDAEHLALRAASPVPQVLQRDHSEPAFKDRITLDGESALTENGATFKECRTGLVLPVVVDAGAYRQLRHHHRTMNASGKLALTMLEGHLVTAGDGATTSERLVVDQFISIKPGTGC
jgi:copper homeostasis protein (lipoprotein)